MSPRWFLSVSRLVLFRLFARGPLSSLTAAPALFRHSRLGRRPGRSQSRTRQSEHQQSPNIRTTPGLHDSMPRVENLPSSGPDDTALCAAAFLRSATALGCIIRFDAFSRMHRFQAERTLLPMNDGLQTHYAAGAQSIYWNCKSNFATHAAVTLARGGVIWIDMADDRLSCPEPRARCCTLRRWRF